MLYHIYHSTQFSYQQWVGFSHNLVRLKPRNTPCQTLIDFSLTIDPLIAEMDEYDDYFGNHLSHLLVREPHHVLKVIAKSCVAMDNDAIIAKALSYERAKTISQEHVVNAFKINSSSVFDAQQFRISSRFIHSASNDLRAYALKSFAPNRPLLEGVEEFMGRIFHDFTFVSGFSDISTPVETVFQKRQGVCQDFAHLAITALRSLGLAVRYVSGYLETLPPEGEQKLFGADASHAWFSVFIPDFGWFDFDPTNNIIPQDKHIVLAYGRDYGDVAPMQGVVYGSGMSHLNVMVDVSRENESVE
jgi:transglutaminase-like putative cysteine protease